MGYEAWFALSVVVVMLGFLALTKIGPDTVLMGGVTLLLITGVLSPSEALSGLANEGMVTVGVLYIVAVGIDRTGLTVVIVDYLLGKPRSMLTAQLRLQVPTTVVSAFTNNTPQVAIMIPAVEQWCRRHDLPVSKFMIPLSYASLLGMWTLIGTSTNLIVNGLLMSQAKAPSLGMFDIAWVGVPVSILGLAFMILFSKWLLPDRRPGISFIENTREYTVEMIVQPGGRLDGKTVEEAGLRNLPNMYLAEIERRGHVLSAVSNQELLEGNDRLLFVGAVNGAVDLQKIKGLMPATEQVFKLRPPRSDRSLLEAVVSHGSPLVGRSIRQGRFRARYNAVVLAVARHGTLLKSKVGDVVLLPGDTLLLEARPSFFEEYRYTRDFYLVSPIEDSSPPRHERAPVALIILGGMVVLATLEWLSMLQAAMLAAGFMIMTGCVSGSDARSSIDTEVLLTIAASIGLGQALLKTGAGRGYRQRPYRICRLESLDGFDHGVYYDLNPHRSSRSCGSSGADLSHSNVDGPIPGRKRRAVCHLDYDVRVPGICQPHSESDPPHGLGPGRIPLHRFLAHGNTDGHNDRRSKHTADPEIWPF